MKKCARHAFVRQTQDFARVNSYHCFTELDLGYVNYNDWHSYLGCRVVVLVHLHCAQADRSADMLCKEPNFNGTRSKVIRLTPSLLASITLLPLPALPPSPRKTTNVVSSSHA